MTDDIEILKKELRLLADLAQIHITQTHRFALDCVEYFRNPSEQARERIMDYLNTARDDMPFLKMVWAYQSPKGSRLDPYAERRGYGN